MSFLWNVHSYLATGIRIADAKAAAIGASVFALLALTLDRGGLVGTIGLDVKLWGAEEWLSAVSVLLLVLSLLAAAIGLIPRLSKTANSELVYWGSIFKSYRTSNEFWGAVQERDAVGLGKTLASDVFTLAQLTHKKFLWARRALVLALAGFVAGALGMLIQRTAVFRGGPRATEVSLPKVVVAQYGDLLLYAPLYIAHSQGLFARRGLNVEIVSTGGDDKTFAAVVAGSAQFGVADPTFVAIARERGQLGKVVGLLIDGVPNYGVAASSQARPINRPADLAGKTVATVPAPSTSYALMVRLFRSAGLEPRILQVAAAGLIPSLKAGKAHYALLIEPWVSQIVSEGGHVAFSLTHYYRHFALTGITTTEAVIAKHPDLVREFLGAMTEAVRLFYEDRGATLGAVKKRFAEQAEPILEQAVERLRSDQIYPRCLAMTEAAWSPAVELRKEVGDLRGEVLPLAEYVDNRFALSACGATTRP